MPNPSAQPLVTQLQMTKKIQAASNADGADDRPRTVRSPKSKVMLLPLGVTLNGVPNGLISVDRPAGTMRKLPNNDEAVDNTGI